MKQADTIAVKEGEGLDLRTLETFLRRNLTDLPDGHLTVEQFWAGHSNLTYQLEIGDWEAVLRRPPLGPVAPKAHDMNREFKILSALHSHFSPAPEPILFSDDESVVGSPFFIMERKRGIVLDTSFPEGLAVTPEICRGLSQTMVDWLVELHAIDYKKTGLVEISNPDGFMERQVHGWIGRYGRAKTDDIPEAERLKVWMTANMPKSQPPTVIHYDYKLNNAMFSGDLKEMIGLFDWEMSTVGDPLADLGAAMSYWIQHDDPKLLKFGLGKPSVTITEGFMSRQEFIEAYATKSGRDVSDMDFYLTFAYFKLAVICQQIYFRYRKGQTNDARFAHFDQFVKTLLVHAASVIED
ncbi:phosphotransferase family protein [Jeotgalibacillus aurantiacus]|uniref:phosphotransferase family protein n=1 Tax=Jeotgalibacillus aurantiacus TaxID=2763266 RepID=UPI001D0B66E9|nr:phosphotransferase family protein [Jeotgalibacillus aurantiacus]